LSEGSTLLNSDGGIILDLLSAANNLMSDALDLLSNELLWLLLPIADSLIGLKVSLSSSSEPLIPPLFLAELDP